MAVSFKRPETLGFAVSRSPVCGRAQRNEWGATIGRRHGRLRMLFPFSLVRDFVQSAGVSAHIFYVSKAFNDLSIPDAQIV
ncbi:hypothetical protein ASD52_03775 [Ensifer sp. Root142]|nr:hypothetical protein ASD52_03775 [Ensifer sp. Root142]